MNECPLCGKEINNLYDLYTEYYNEHFLMLCPHCDKIIRVIVKVQKPLFELEEV